MSEPLSRQTPSAQPPSSPDWQYRPAADLGLGPVERLRSIKREQGLISWSVHHAALGSLRAYLQIYHRFTVVGREHLPRQTPFVLIANHASHLDALILAAALPRAVATSAFPVAAGDVFFESPARSAFAAVFLNALPLWRKKATGHALEDLRTRLLEGPTGLILFPEGARSRDGAMLPFKPGIGRIIAQTSVPVVPCRLEGAFEAMRPGTWLPRPRRITVRVGPALTFEDEVLFPATREGYGAIAGKLREAVGGLGRERGADPR